MEFYPQVAHGQRYDDEEQPQMEVSEYTSPLAMVQFVLEPMTSFLK